MALTTQDGIIPAPYLARYHWICITQNDAIPMEMGFQLVEESYQLVLNKLPAKIRKSLT